MLGQITFNKITWFISLYTIPVCFLLIHHRTGNLILPTTDSSQKSQHKNKSPFRLTTFPANSTNPHKYPSTSKGVG